MPRLNLRTKLLLFSIALAIIPLVVAGRTMIRIAQDELKSSANDELSTTAKQLAEEVTDLYENTWLAPLLLVRNAIDNEQLGVQEKISLLTLGIKDIPDLVALQITLAQAPIPIVVSRDDFAARLSNASLDALETLRVPADKIAAAGRQREGLLGAPVHIAQTDDWLATIVLPLRSRLAGQEAVLSARIDLGRLRSFVRTHPFNKTGEITIVDAGGQRVFDPAQSDLTDFEIVDQATTLVASGSQIISVEPYMRPSGEIMLGAFSFPRPFAWAILVEKNERDAYLAVDKMIESLLLWVVVGLGVAAVGAVIFALRISRPILEIARVAVEVGTGNFRARVKSVKSRDEIGDLAQRINEMVVGLAERFHLQKLVSTGTMRAIEGVDDDAGLPRLKRRASILFTDLRGFTSFAERVGPDTVVDMLNHYFSRQADIVARYSGDIDKFVGDSLIAVFRGDDKAKNAVQCALEIQDSMAELNREREDWNFLVGIGINTGEVVMGPMGSDRRMDYTVLGDTVNLAARLCSDAKPGQTLVSESTNRLISGLEAVKAIQLAPIRVKGKSQPLIVFEVRRSRPDEVGAEALSA